LIVGFAEGDEVHRTMPDSQELRHLATDGYLADLGWIRSHIIMVRPASLCPPKPDFGRRRMRGESLPSGLTRGSARSAGVRGTLNGVGLRPEVRAPAFYAPLKKIPIFRNILDASPTQDYKPSHPVPPRGVSGSSETRGGMRWTLAASGAAGDRRAGFP
jgi:hypothetical protein